MYKVQTCARAGIETFTEAEESQQNEEYSMAQLNDIRTRYLLYQMADITKTCPCNI